MAIDGAWADWAAVPSLWENTGPMPVPQVPRQVVATNDDSALYLHLTVADTINLQAMPGSLRLVLDTDGSPATGAATDGLPGADLIVEFSPPTRTGLFQGARTRVLPNGDWRDGYHAGLWYAPTFSDRQFEVRLARRPISGPVIGDRVALLIAAIDTTGAVRAATPTLVYHLDDRPGGPLPAGADALAKDRGTVRVITWNVGDDGILLAPDGFRATLAALAPDVILFDELHPTITAATLRSLLPNGGPGWSLELGGGGGRQRTAVASHYPLATHPGLARVPYPDSLQALLGQAISSQMEADIRTAPGDGIPTIGVVATIERHRILFVPIDLFCCGGHRGAEERARRMTALAVREAVLRVATTVDAIVIGGDLNLVGSRHPWELLSQGLDPVSGGTLVSAAGQRLDRGSTATWFAPGPFPPGKLDYLVFSASRLGLRRSFSFHPDDLTGTARLALGLRAPAQTDHLPLVADLELRFP